MKNKSLSSESTVKELACGDKKMMEYLAPEAIAVGKAGKLLQGGYCSYWDQSDYTSCTAPNPK